MNDTQQPQHQDTAIIAGSTDSNNDKENRQDDVAVIDNVPHKCNNNKDDRCLKDDARKDSEAATTAPIDPPILSTNTTLLHKHISKQVLRHKLQKLRHLVVTKAINPDYLDGLFPRLLELWDPQPVTYNGGIANVKQWKISCYLEVMEGGVPCTNPHVELLDLFTPLLEECNALFLYWYKQQHACNGKSKFENVKKEATSCRRLMTFITRYTPAPGEQALLKHVDGAGKVDGSVVVALPVDRWSAPESINMFEGGGIRFWDGKEKVDNGKGMTTTRPREMHYDSRSGDIAFIDRAVWHQADPITKGTRWALVIFYKVE